jgi:hypothetical protein
VQTLPSPYLVQAVALPYPSPPTPCPVSTQPSLPRPAHALSRGRWYLHCCPGLRGGSRVQGSVKHNWPHRPFQLFRGLGRNPVDDEASSQGIAQHSKQHRVPGSKRGRETPGQGVSSGERATLLSSHLFTICSFKNITCRCCCVPSCVGLALFSVFVF